jgi:hypothetical protein
MEICAERKKQDMTVGAQKKVFRGIQIFDFLFVPLPRRMHRIWLEHLAKFIAVFQFLLDSPLARSNGEYAWREFDVCMPYAALSANKRQIQKRHEKFIVARGSRDSDIWSGTSSNGSQMSESNH